ncbi:hypothetical protein RUND412_009637 [Rhizina undulata]
MTDSSDINTNPPPQKSLASLFDRSNWGEISKKQAQPQPAKSKSKKKPESLTPAISDAENPPVEPSRPKRRKKTESRRLNELTIPIDLTAPPTLLTPSSSPRDGEGDGSAEGCGEEIDLNHGRRKRRKKMAVSAQLDVGEDEVIMDAMPDEGEPTVEASGLVSYQDRILTIRSPRVLDLVKGIEDVREPVPVLTNAFAVLGKKTGKAKGKEKEKETEAAIEVTSTDPPEGKRTTCSFDGKTGILSIHSSPLLIPSSPISLPPTIVLASESASSSLPPSKSVPISTPITTTTSAPLPPSKNAFALLGKKKAPPPPQLTIDQKEHKPPQTQNESKPPPPPSTMMATTTPAVTLKEPPPSKPQPKKVLHPFFQPGGMKKLAAKAIPAEPASVSETNSDSEGLFPSSTGCSSTGTSQKSERFLNPSGSGDGLGGGLSPTSNRVMRTPGLKDAAWPARGTSHVRGLEDSGWKMPVLEAGLGLGLERKLKERRVAIAPEEAVLGKVVEGLGITTREEREAIEKDGEYTSVREELRLPKRLIITGSELQEIMRERVKARLPHPFAPRSVPRSEDSDEDSDAETEAKCKVHPAILKLYYRLRDELTAYDKSEHETQAWECKYAPTSTSEVLHSSPEMTVLRNWLVNLMVEADPNAASSSSSKKKKSKKSKPPPPKKKKKPRAEKLDGFVISSDEERAEMDVLEYIDAPGAPGGKKSIVRAGNKDWVLTGKEPEKMPNIVVISGPTGSGKTAAVYAAAKELGYTVFEVSPGTRRNGKDLLDLVGEMSRNHLVHQSKASSASGSFFDNKARKAGTGTGNDEKSVQSQSLILLEEVDILFEEDKNYWSTVCTLGATSKRPIILTCNDESLIPLDSLSLQAVLRFSMPAIDTMLDYLLLMAANEGHILKRSAVKSLVEAVNGDLRAAILELEFWCRIGVGDRMSGLEWLYIRWPPGADVAENGEVRRVVSKGTYWNGLGCVGGGDEAVLEDAWENGGVDLAEVWGEELAGMGSREWAEWAEGLSDADVCSRGMAAQPILDPTAPPRTWKQCSNDMVGYKTLQTDALPQLLSTAISISIRTFLKPSPSPLSPLHKTPATIPPSPLLASQLTFPFLKLSQSEPIFATTPCISHSCILRPLSILTAEIAPYVRAIVRSDERRRRRLNGLVSLGGKKRVTRASRAAEMGGDRGRERWLGDVDVGGVLASGGTDWGEAVEEVLRPVVAEMEAENMEE